MCCSGAAGDEEATFSHWGFLIFSSGERRYSASSSSAWYVRTCLVSGESVTKPRPQAPTGHQNLGVLISFMDCRSALWPEAAVNAAQPCFS